MTPADAPNPSDGPLAATKPPEDFASQPTGNRLGALAASGTGMAPSRRAFHYGCLSDRALALRLARKHRLTITGAIRSP